MDKTYLVTPLALALLLAGCAPPGKSAGGKTGGGKQDRRNIKFPVELRKVIAYPVEYSISAVGSVDAFERVEVVARVAGVLEKLDFEEGTRVSRDQVLAVVDPDRYRIAVEAAKAAKVRAEAALAEAQDALERRRKLSQANPGALTQEEISSAAAKVRIQSAEVAQAKSALEAAELDLKESSVRSPVDGIVQARLARTGQFVQRGTTIATLLQRDPLQLRFTVPSIDASRLRTGMTVRFTVPGQEKPFRAIITYISGAAEATSRMVSVTARVDDPANEALKPGSFAEVTVPIDTGAENPVIPQAAIRPSERGYVAFIAEDGIAKERIVQLGLRTADGFVEVRSGLKPGDMLVVRGSEALREGAAVQVEEPKGAGTSGKTTKGAPGK